MSWFKRKAVSVETKVQQSPFSLRLRPEQTSYIYGKSKEQGKSRNQVIVDIVDIDMKKKESNNG